jgi:hypothetical protein
LLPGNRHRSSAQDFHEVEVDDADYQILPQHEVDRLIPLITAGLGFCIFMHNSEDDVTDRMVKVFKSGGIQDFFPHTVGQREASTG